MRVIIDIPHDEYEDILDRFNHTPTDTTHYERMIAKGIPSSVDNKKMIWLYNFEDGTTFELYNSLSIAEIEKLIALHGEVTVDFKTR